MKTYPVLKHHAMKTYKGVEIQIHAVIHSTLGTGRFTPKEIAPDAPLIGGFMNTRSGLDMVAKTKSP
jgi:hypothetical protein